MARPLVLAARVGILVGLLTGCADEPEGPLIPLEGEELAGGDTTVFDETRLAYALAFRNLDHDQRGDHFVGNSFFNQNWVQSPSSTEGRDGLGPVFNAKSCSGCHFRDGRGQPPADDEPMTTMLVRLSVPGTAADGGPLPVPGYGGQLQSQGILDVPAEGDAFVDYEDVPGEYEDGTPYTLRRPTIRFEGLAFGPMPADLMISPRVAPAVIGLGVLAAVPEDHILDLVDPDDADGDGISGRANYPFDPVSGGTALGRFGWKANQVGLLQQNTGAFKGDIGITTALQTGQNCADGQAECAAAVEGEQPEAGDQVVQRVTFYTRTLAVPARRGVDDPDVLEGRELFHDFGCAACHVPSWTTTNTFDDLPQAGDQLIWPYTDLLLHDMGEDLSDGRPDYDASGAEWRTPPLWGLGLLQQVNEHTTLLHDGRARDAEEAILWHGGEAEDARAAFVAAEANERAQLLRFLESL